MQIVLTALKDIPGVVGSFVLTPRGALAAREMPTVYPDDIFPELGRRLASIGEIVEAQMGSMLELLMKFENYKVFVRQASNCWLTVLVADSVNFPALRMATNVALKQVVSQMEANPVPTPAPAAAAAPAAPVTAPAPVKPQRYFRGSAI